MDKDLINSIGDQLENFSSFTINELKIISTENEIIKNEIGLELSVLKTKYDILNVRLGLNETKFKENELELETIKNQLEAFYHVLSRLKMATIGLSILFLFARM
jgi:hypothetical protein